MEVTSTPGGKKKIKEAIVKVSTAIPAVSRSRTFFVWNVFIPLCSYFFFHFFRPKAEGPIISICFESLCLAEAQ